MSTYRKTQLARRGTFVVLFRSNGKLAFPHKWAKAAQASYHILLNVKASDYGLYEVGEGSRHVDNITHKDGATRGTSVGARC